MKVAVVGAGFSGLSVCYHLLQYSGWQISLFDEKGVGGGASGVSSGLLHPYPGLNGRLSWNALCCLNESKELIKTVECYSSEPLADYSGILRHALTDEQVLRFKHYADMQQIQENLFLIRSGITIFAERYLQALWNACKVKGGVLYQEKISSLDQLKQFDVIVLAAGWGMRLLLPSNPLQLNYTKGQRLRCHTKSALRSAIARGYLSTCGDPQFCEIGSTYERGFSSDLPCKETAVHLLKQQIDFFYPEASIETCLAGVRVSRTGNYLPIAEKIGKNCYVLTAMGSRGLLYHAYFGKRLAERIFCEVKLCTG